MGCRIVICVDLESADPVEAYRELFNLMAKSGLDWESSDEWYADDGESIHQDDQQEVRMKVFAERDKVAGGSGGHNDLRGT